MMKNITRLEKAIPVRTSTRAARSSESRSPRRPRSGLVAPLAVSSSTSEDACQKKRYGEMVVPKTATRAMTKSFESSKCGMTVALSTSSSGGWAKKAVMTYAKRASVNHLKILKMVA